MRRLRKWVTVSAASIVAVGAASVLGVADASAIDRVPCNNQNYLTTYSQTGNTCWANNGAVQVTLYQVASVSSGNNSGYVLNTSGYKWNFISKVTFVTGNSTLIYINITGR